MKLHDPQARASIALAGKTFFKNADGSFDVPDSLSASARKQGLVEALPGLPHAREGVSAEAALATDVQPVVIEIKKMTQEKPATLAAQTSAGPANK